MVGTCILPCVLLAKLHRGSLREHRPEILFRIYEDGVKPEKAEIWLDNGRVVLDPDNHPVIDYPQIPKACSSQMEGWNMQAIQRINPRISHMDFRARMPHTQGPDKKPLFGPTTFSNRMWRFRKEACCLSLRRRAGTEALKKYIIDLLPMQCMMDNSTREFRDLTKEELATMDRLNKGKFTERAGVRSQGVAATNKRRNGSDDINSQPQVHVPESIASEQQGSQKRKRPLGGDTEAGANADSTASLPGAKRPRRNLPLPCGTLSSQDISGSRKRKAEATETLETSKTNPKHQKRAKARNIGELSVHQTRPPIDGYQHASLPQNPVVFNEPGPSSVTDDYDVQPYNNWSAESVDQHSGVNPNSAEDESHNPAVLFQADLNAESHSTQLNAAYPLTTAAPPASNIYEDNIYEHSWPLNLPQPLQGYVYRQPPSTDSPVYSTIS